MQTRVSKWRSPWRASYLTESLKHVLVISDGLNVNGSKLVAGLTSHLPAHVTLTGGLAETATVFRKHCFMGGPAEADTIAVLGFYGDRLKSVWFTWRLGCFRSLND